MKILKKEVGFMETREIFKKQSKELKPSLVDLAKYEIKHIKD